MFASLLEKEISHKNPVIYFLLKNGKPCSAQNLLAWSQWEPDRAADGSWVTAFCTLQSFGVGSTDKKYFISLKRVLRPALSSHLLQIFTPRKLFIASSEDIKFSLIQRHISTTLSCVLIAKLQRKRIIRARASHCGSIYIR